MRSPPGWRLVWQQSPSHRRFGGTRVAYAVVAAVATSKLLSNARVTGRPNLESPPVARFQKFARRHHVARTFFCCCYYYCYSVTSSSLWFFFFFCSVVDLSSFLNARARARARHYLTETRGESATQRRQYCFAIGKALPRVHWTLVRKTNRTADRSFEISLLLLLLLLLLLVFVLWSTVFDCAGPLVWSQCVFLIFPTNYSLIFIRIFLFLLVFL